MQSLIQLAADQDATADDFRSCINNYIDSGEGFPSPQEVKVLRKVKLNSLLNGLMAEHACTKTAAALAVLDLLRDPDTDEESLVRQINTLTRQPITFNQLVRL